MYQNKFVSLHFTSNKLQAALLNSAKNTIEKIATTDLPAGLITAHKVVDTKALASLIKEFLHKNGIYERAVGIVVPEFSTFIKTITLPILEHHELDEAIRWQSQEFLPLPIDQIVLDWKVISRNEKEVVSLVVAIPKDVLTGFVEAVAQAGLFPLVVETPSLTLSRLGKAGVSRMILYASFGEAVLIVTKGEKILGSVVTTSTDEQTILQTASAMKARFASENISNLAIGGTEVTKQVYDDLEKVLNLPVEWIQISMRNLAPNQMQEYLIPLSQQLKPAAEPDDENTINLLPPQWVSQYEEKHLKARVWSMSFITTVVITAVLIANVVVYLMINTQIGAFKSTNGEQSQLSTEVQEEIKAINDATARVAKIEASFFDPQEVINQITTAKPAEVTITDYALDFEEGKISIRGSSLTRQGLFSFKQGLEKSDDFGVINIPLSSFEVEQNVPFELNFDYKPAMPQRANQSGKLKL